MNIPKLQLQSTKAQIGLTIQQPVQEIEQPKADLDLQQPQAKLSIETKRSKLSIDSFRAREDAGYKTSQGWTAEIAQQSKQDVLEGIARRAQEGTEMVRIENGGSALAEQAKRRWGEPYSGININYIPQAGSVNVNYEPVKVDIQVDPQNVINNTKINKPIHQYTPGKTKVEMLQHASLKIDWLV